MTTWAQLLGYLRAELKDPEGTRFSDDLLYLWAKDAIRTYSLYFPRRLNRLGLEGVEGRYTLPADFMVEVAVECPKDTFIEKRLTRPGIRFLTRSLSYQIEGSQLVLNGSPLEDSDLLLTYNAFHPVPASSADDAFELTVPEADEEVLRTYIRAKAYGQLRSGQSSLDRFKVGGGKRDDNPMRPEVGSLMDEFYALISERTTGGTIQLWRPGRMR